MNPQHYPHVRNFLSGYYHQDWRYDYQTVEAAARAYVAETSADEVRLTLAELRVLLSSEALQSPQADLHTLGCYYNPRRTGQTPADWLSEVATTVETALNQRES